MSSYEDNTLLHIGKRLKRSIWNIRGATQHIDYTIWLLCMPSLNNRGKNSEDVKRPNSRGLSMSHTYLVHLTHDRILLFYSIINILISHPEEI